MTLGNAPPPKHLSITSGIAVPHKESCVPLDSRSPSHVFSSTAISTHTRLARPCIHCNSALCSPDPNTVVLAVSDCHIGCHAQCFTPLALRVSDRNGNRVYRWNAPCMVACARFLAMGSVMESLGNRSTVTASGGVGCCIVERIWSSRIGGWSDL